jgi:uncharacterized phage protein (TIGR01671 family)
MRPIKFRAWSIEGKTMWYISKQMTLSIEGDSWQIRDNVIGNRFMCSWHEDEKGVLMQFTGLLDKNGKEIYEGDIIKWADKNWVVSWNKRNSQYFMETIKSFIEKDDSLDYPKVYGEWHWCRDRMKSYSEVIGNIYENPELLKTKEEQG